MELQHWPWWIIHMDPPRVFLPLHYEYRHLAGTLLLDVHHDDRVQPWNYTKYGDDTSTRHMDDTRRCPRGLIVPAATMQGVRSELSAMLLLPDRIGDSELRVGAWVIGLSASLGFLRQSKNHWIVIWTRRSFFLSMGVVRAGSVQAGGHRLF